jgi:hypothetical protein
MPAPAPVVLVLVLVLAALVPVLVPVLVRTDSPGVMARARMPSRMVWAGVLTEARAVMAVSIEWTGWTGWAGWTA